MAIETLDDWNAILGQCCCEMPECPVPTMECEQKTASKTCDHGSEGEAYEADHAQWVIDYAEWEAGGYVGPEPVEPLIPDGVSYGCWVQWTRPAGDDEDKMPLLYRKSTYAATQGGEDWFNGTLGYKNALNDWYFNFGTPPPDYWLHDSTSYWFQRTWAGEPADDGTVSRSQSYAEFAFGGTPVSCDTDTASGDIYGVGDLAGSWSLSEADSWNCAAEVITYTGEKYTQNYGTEQTADSCPCPYAEGAAGVSGGWGQNQGGASLTWEWADIEKSLPGHTLTLGDSITQAALFAAAIADLAAKDWSSGTCMASSASNWPTIGEYDWTIDCENLYHAHNGISDWRSFPANFLAQVRKIRFRWVVPQDWSPIAQPGSYFKVTWDILEEPDGWDAPSPTVFRSFVATDQTWEWTGPGDPEDPDSWKSGWYEIAPPSLPGTRRVVNIRFECYRSTRFGNKPQVTGEAVELPDP